MKPIFTWAGGKTKFISILDPLLRPMPIYCEPFFGGGAVFCRMIERDIARHYIINDINPEIVGLYRSIRDDDNFIRDVVELESDYLHSEVRKQWFLDAREYYWTHQSSALLYIMMQTSFNGIWRSSKASEGLYAANIGSGIEIKRFIDYKNLEKWRQVLQRCEITNQDFGSLNFDEPAMIYCDPPYIETKIDYSSGFTDADQVRCFNWCKQLSEQGSRAILQNKSNGTFFEELITDEKVTYVKYRHRAGGGYGVAVNEIIIQFIPDDSTHGQRFIEVEDAIKIREKNTSTFEISWINEITLNNSVFSLESIEGDELNISFSLTSIVEDFEVTGSFHQHPTALKDVPDSEFVAIAISVTGSEWKIGMRQTALLLEQFFSQVLSSRPFIGFTNIIPERKISLIGTGKKLLSVSKRHDMIRELNRSCGWWDDDSDESLLRNYLEVEFTEVSSETRDSLAKQIDMFDMKAIRQSMRGF